MLADQKTLPVETTVTARPSRPGKTSVARDALTVIGEAGAAIAAGSGRDAALERATQRRKALAAEAEAAAPGAIALATTETERDLIRRLYADIPGVLALSQVHSESDHANAPSLDADWTAWEDARRAVEGLAEQLVKLPPETAKDAHRRVKLYRHMLTLTEGAPGHDNDQVFAEDLQVMGDGAIAALAALSQREVPPPGPWTDALAAYRVAVAEGEAASKAANDARDELERSMPIPPILQIGPGRWYFREEHIRRDVLQPYPGNKRLTVEDAAAKLAALAEFGPLYEAAQQRLQVEELEEAHAAALGHQGRLAEALINVPAPNFEAAAEKLRILLFEWHGADHPEGVAAFLTGPDPDIWAACRVMQDLMRLNGTPSDLIDVEPFDPDPFIEEFERLPGCLMTGNGPQWDFPSAWPGLLSEQDYNAHFTVKEPERLTLYCDERGIEGAEREVYLQGGVFGIDAIALMFPDDPAKIENLRTLAAEQTAIRKGAPVGTPEWNGLKRYQKDAVKAAARRRSTAAKEAGQ